MQIFDRFTSSHHPDNKALEHASGHVSIAKDTKQYSKQEIELEKKKHNLRNMLEENQKAGLFVGSR